jgi:predicted short-subunit dehydrogenase-like oxidoreductase (DUF2520 family)
MQATIIGSGNVGTVLGRVLKAKGYTIRQVYSRTAEHARLLADELGAVAVFTPGSIDKEADIYLLTITDNAVASVAAQISVGDKLVVHTAGSISKEILKDSSSSYGVLWPMKMIRTTMPELGAVNMVIDGNSTAVVQQIQQLARQFSDHITVADDSKRVKMHLVAAVVSNFTNHLYHLSADYCLQEQIDFALFYPIIEETARQVQDAHPREVQAGPAYRKDTRTIDAHIQLLLQYPALKELYEKLTNSILQKNSLPVSRHGG